MSKENQVASEGVQTALSEDEAAIMDCTETQKALDSLTMNTGETPTQTDRRCRMAGRCHGRRKFLRKYHGDAEAGRWRHFRGHHGKMWDKKWMRKMLWRRLAFRMFMEPRGCGGWRRGRMMAAMLHGTTTDDSSSDERWGRRRRRCCRGRWAEQSDEPTGTDVERPEGEAEKQGDSNEQTEVQPEQSTLREERVRCGRIRRRNCHFRDRGMRRWGRRRRYQSSSSSDTSSSSDSSDSSSDEQEEGQEKEAEPRKKESRRKCGRIQWREREPTEELAEEGAKKSEKRPKRKKAKKLEKKMKKHMKKGRGYCRRFYC